MGTSPVGIIYGDVGSTEFQIAVSDPILKRLDYVEAEHDGRRVLGIVDAVTRRSHLSYDQALAGDSAEERLGAHVHVIGFRDDRGRIQTPRTPFSAGCEVHLADERLVTTVLGLQSDGHGAYLGHVKGLAIPVHLNPNTLAQKHISVLAKTGAGKSYTVGVILEEFLLAKVPLVILDPHGEYSALRSPNMDPGELDAMVRYGVKPKAFQSQVKEYALDTALNPDAEKLRLEGINLEAREIVDLLPTKLSGAQVGALYQAVKDVVDTLPAYTLQDVIEAVERNKSNAKWNVINALEALQSTGLFAVRGTPVKELVQPGQCTVINLKGIPPDVQEVVAARLAGMLWDARKRNVVPPHMLVVEEAHNFCPERGVGNAVSGPVLRTIASEGRKFGLGLVIVSQRPAKIDKNVLSQCSTQIVMKVTNPNDLKAIVASVEGITSASADEVQRLPVGVALVAGGGLTQPVLVDVRPRMTRHGGASIDVVRGKAARAPEPVVPKAAPTRATVPAQPSAPAPPPDRQKASPTTTQRASSFTPRKTQSAATRTPPSPEPAPRNGKDRHPSRAATPPSSQRAARKAPPEPTAVFTPAEVPHRSHPTAQPKSRGPPNPGADAPRSDARNGSSDVRSPAPNGFTSASPTTRQTSQSAGADPVQAAIARAQSARAATRGQHPETPGKPKALAKKDLAEVVRVAQRIGVAGSDDPGRVQALLESLAMREGRPADHYVRQYLHIAQAACHDDAPACIRCPLRDACHFHQKLQQQRQKRRSVIRRLWGN